MLEIYERQLRIGSNGVLALLFYYGSMIAWDHIFQPMADCRFFLSMISWADHSASTRCAMQENLTGLETSSEPHQFHPHSLDCLTGCSYCWLLVSALFIVWSFHF